MVDTPNNPESFIDAIKYALIPFTGIGGWYGVRWAWEQFMSLSARGSERRREASGERDKIKATLDGRQADYMDRLERRLESLQQECEHLRKCCEEEVQRANQERDIVYQIALDREERAHRRRHDHVNLAQKYNSLLGYFERLVEGRLSPEAVAEIKTLRPEPEPDRIPDLRVEIRAAAAAAHVPQKLV